MIRSILVPLDGSAFGEHALPLAAGLARLAGTTLHLVHVHQSAPPLMMGGVVIMDTLDEQLRQDEYAYLADAGKRLGEAVPVPVETAVLNGEAPLALRQYVEQHGTDLLVLSTHGRGALGRFWLGSVADELLRTMPRPMLLVRPHGGEADLRQIPDLKSILLPLDGSALAEQVIEPALSLGVLFGSAFTLLRVNKPMIRPPYLPEGAGLVGLEMAMEQIDRLQRQAHKESQEYLDRVAAGLKARGVQVHTRVVIDEHPAAAILREAEGGHANLIALETHGRRGLSRLLLGSVADKIVRASLVPVLVNRPGR